MRGVPMNPLLIILLFILLDANAAAQAEECDQEKSGNPVPMFDPTYRPGDNLFTNSAISLVPDSGKMNWYFQFTPGDMWDYDEVGTHIMIDGVDQGHRPEDRQAARLRSQQGHPDLFNVGQPKPGRAD
jgi:hypothetical protein